MENPFGLFLSSLIIVIARTALSAQTWNVLKKLGALDLEAADHLERSTDISISFMMAGARWPEVDDATINKKWIKQMSL